MYEVRKNLMEYSGKMYCIDFPMEREIAFAKSLK